jgi:hypothetical protein
MEYHTITERYFENLDLPESVKTNLMGRLDLQLQTLSEKVQDALSISADQMQKCAFQLGKTDTSAGKTDTSAGKTDTSAGQAQWKKCEGTCKSLITDAVNQEIGSTAFMLKLLADSVIRPDGKPHRLKFGLDPSFFQGKSAESEAAKGKSAASGCRLLTGRWKDDAPFLRLVLPSSNPNGPPPKGGLSKGPRPSGRLVMGFGPSAAGKTHWAKIILDLLQKADTTQNGAAFPEVFFAVDGGLVRESSAVYQFATEMAHCAGFAGFTNLHAGMFVTGDIKHAMEKYLLQESQRVAISLYVPETLAKCEYKGIAIPYVGKIPYGSFVASCMDYLKPFLDITKDTAWIGLLIWQHATAADHGKDTEFLRDYSDPKYECEGCEASGRKRETGEGKKYEGHVYAQSMKNGRKYMELAPGGRYEIHNAGRRDGMSVMWDRSPRTTVYSSRTATMDRFSEIMQASAKEKGIQYVDARVVEEKRAERNAAAAASKWKNIETSSKTIEASTNSYEEASSKKKKDLNTIEASMRNIRREALKADPFAFDRLQNERRATGYTGSVLRNVADAVYASRNRTRNANPNALRSAKRIREASNSLNARKQAEAAAANAYYAERQAAHSTRSIASRIAANEAEGTQEAAAKRLAASKKRLEEAPKNHDRNGENELSVNDFDPL